jgi:hypothetical protein
VLDEDHAKAAYHRAIDPANAGVKAVQAFDETARFVERYLQQAHSGEDNPEHNPQYIEEGFRLLGTTSERFNADRQANAVMAAQQTWEKANDPAASPQDAAKYLADTKMYLEKAGFDKENNNTGAGFKLLGPDVTEQSFGQLLQTKQPEARAPQGDQQQMRVAQPRPGAAS